MGRHGESLATMDAFCPVASHLVCVHVSSVVSEHRVCSRSTASCLHLISVLAAPGPLINKPPSSTTTAPHPTPQGKEKRMLVPTSHLLHQEGLSFTHRSLVGCCLGLLFYQWWSSRILGLHYLISVRCTHNWTPCNF